MEYPSPNDPKRAPVWDNYIVAQACTAALGLVPMYAHALGVRVNNYAVVLVVQAPEGPAVETDEDVVDIAEDLESLLGPEAVVTVEVQRRQARRLDPDDGVSWFFAARV